MWRQKATPEKLSAGCGADGGGNGGDAPVATGIPPRWGAATAGMRRLLPAFRPDGGGNGGELGVISRNSQFSILNSQFPPLSFCSPPRRAIFAAMSECGTIHLTDVLRLLDEVTDAEGKYLLHSVGFITYAQKARSERGRYRVMRCCHKTGLPFGVSKNMMRGLRDSVTGEVRAVHIRLIVMFDGMKVLW